MDDDPELLTPADVRKRLKMRGATVRQLKIALSRLGVGWSYLSKTEWRVGAEQLTAALRRAAKPPKRTG